MNFPGQRKAMQTSHSCKCECACACMSGLAKRSIWFSILSSANNSFFQGKHIFFERVSPHHYCNWIALQMTVFMLSCLYKRKDAWPSNKASVIYGIMFPRMEIVPEEMRRWFVVSGGGNLMQVCSKKKTQKNFFLSAWMWESTAVVAEKETQPVLQRNMTVWESGKKQSQTSCDSTTAVILLLKEAGLWVRSAGSVQQASASRVCLVCNLLLLCSRITLLKAVGLSVVATDHVVWTWT